jgi:sugar phosphate isomerase/epimerase
MLKLATKCKPAMADLDQAYRAGFHHVELWLDATVLADWQGAAKIARYFSLSYALHFPNSLSLPTEALDQTVALYRALTPSCVIIHQPMFDRYGEALLKREPKLLLAVENHKLTPAQFDEWAERHPGLTLDVEHLWMLTLQHAPLEDVLGRVRQLLRRHGSKLRHVHLPGYWPGFDEHRPMYCAREMVFPILELLAGVGFEGLIVSEVEVTYQNPEELRMDVLLFEAWRRQFQTQLSNVG